MYGEHDYDAHPWAILGQDGYSYPDVNFNTLACLDYLVVEIVLNK